MEIKEASIYVDQNMPVFDGNRFLTIRLGVGLKADVPAGDLPAAVRELHEKAEALLSATIHSARASAQTRIEDLADEQARVIAQEKDVI